MLLARAWLTAKVLLTTVLVAMGLVALGGACSSGLVQLEDGRTIADRLAVQKIAQQEAELRPQRPGLRLVLSDYEVNAEPRDAGNEPGYSFSYVHRRPSVGLGPGQAHFSIWVSRINGSSMYVPGR